MKSFAGLDVFLGARPPIGYLRADSKRRRFVLSRMKAKFCLKASARLSQVRLPSC